MGGLFKPTGGYKEVGGINQYLDPISQFGGPQGFNLGGADFGQKQAKGIMKDIGAGDFSGIIGTYLSPITDAYKVNQRESERDLHMGANAMYQGTQPALMAGLGQTARNQATEQLGLNLASAIPQLYGQAQQAFGAGRQRQIAEMGLDLQSLIAALQGKLGANQLQTGKSLFEQFSGAASAMGGGAGMAALGM
jgi:hypothetical protein